MENWIPVWPPIQVTPPLSFQPAAGRKRALWRGRGGDKKLSCISFPSGTTIGTFKGNPKGKVGLPSATENRRRKRRKATEIRCAPVARRKNDGETKENNGNYGRIPRKSPTTGKQRKRRENDGNDNGETTGTTEEIGREVTTEVPGAKMEGRVSHYHG